MGMKAKLSKSEADFRKLFETKVRIMNGRAEVVVKNNTPPDWRVTIIEAGVKFFYHDGTDDQDGPRLIHLGAGGQYSFWSGNTEDCITQTYTVLRIRADSEDHDAIMDERHGAPQGKCILRHYVILAPKLHIDAESRENGWQEALELRTED